METKAELKGDEYTALLWDDNVTLAVSAGCAARQLIAKPLAITTL